MMIFSKSEILNLSNVYFHFSFKNKEKMAAAMQNMLNNEICKLVSSFNNTSKVKSPANPLKKLHTPNVVDAKRIGNISFDR